ncbi:hypothetical protein ASPZODRAFT_11940 [Penicilliopsis zonata CBS 506.65]|uniref:Calmodulin n=1 Tax=Penicilliopsis zonata CBS 506.65 TaxID=1073090 RepID=A0A1L9SV35_9EURO|nr:hypothetical protein ASPZODRAFT_11940 [Penicilliopsis zonata CBS 506.65]OJJ51092.1 hypothetical protein ASPZODRAFT_11940 [Penicilliopsis zonata CBS 506.65]
MTSSRSPIRGPKRRSAAPAPAATPAKRARSKLAKENDLTADEEAEIKEVFSLFASSHPEFPDEKLGVIPAEDVRKALVALALSPNSSNELSSILSAVDPTNTGYIPYSPFLSVAAAKLHARDDDDDAARAAEVDEAFRLFTRGKDGPITLSHLKRIARELKEDSVGEELLRDMILEANGGGGVAAGVTLEQFRDVMGRAGVF